MRSCESNVEIDQEILNYQMECSYEMGTEI